jgi:hypothetical protein
VQAVAALGQYHLRALTAPTESEPKAALR